MSKTFHTIVIALALAATACSARQGATPTDEASTDVAVADGTSVSIPAFNADSAYAYVERQLACGTRQPGSPGHDRCEAYLTDALRSAGADTVIVDHAAVSISGSPATAAQIVGRFNPDASDRILLLAHWDTRPWADEDPDPANHAKPIPGANDGASGVAVLLEIARQLGLQKPDIGVDILFTDCEDSGVDADESSWGVGTQWWAKHLPYPADGLPRYAVLLDMVGARGAVFPREYFSERWARAVNDKVWRAAVAAGHADRFADRVGGAVTDDHIFLNYAGIPTIDIIEIGHPQTGSFHPSWHTMADDIDIIDRATLAAVGQTMLQLIYSEKSTDI